MEKPRLKTRYNGPICDKVKEQFGIENPMALPRIEKIVVSVGMGKELEGTKLNASSREQVMSDLAQISGQQPIIRRAKKSVSNFKIRQGYEVGAMVTLRGARMWEFLDRLIALAIPRIKDFRGLNPRSFDGRGNYTFGVNEQGIFPEVNMSEVKYTHGMNITLVIENSNDDVSRYLLGEIGFPFTRPDDDPMAMGA
ncbi:MAG: 50S ribosomal protein L5 [Phycisphaeraceae bacterium]|nr:50S ribosomal protein L5 [Phycisphaeraceae bacterium]